MDIIYKNIFNLFDNSSLADSELEKQIGLPKKIIYEWRNKRNKSYKKYLYEISDYFKIPVEALTEKNRISNNEIFLDSLDNLDNLDNEVEKIIENNPDFQNLAKKLSVLDESDLDIINKLIDKLIESKK